jgi:hypothetical protein
LNNTLNRNRIYLLRKSFKTIRFIRKYNKKKFKFKNKYQAKPSYAKYNSIFDISIFSGPDVGISSLIYNKRHSRIIDIPNNFSFCENTDSTIKVYRNLVKTYLADPKQPIFINFSDCSIIGVGAATFLRLTMEAILNDSEAYFRKLRFSR